MTQKVLHNLNFNRLMRTCTSMKTVPWHVHCNLLDDSFNEPR